jgi:hypothetical protein
MPRCRISSLQLDVCENGKLVSEYPWLLSKLNKHMANAKDVKNLNINWSHIPSSLPGNEP